ncbi:MAG: OmpA family protein [Crocinitomicaceae bacterium]
MRYISLLIFVIGSFGIQAQHALINPVCFNSAGDDYCVRKVGESLFFISDFPDSSALRKRDKQGGNWFTNVYEVKDCKRQEAKLMKDGLGEPASINSEWYDGPLSQSVKDSVIFFSNTSEGFFHGNMGIYFSKQLPNGTYSEPITFPYNSDLYSCMHPFYDEANSDLYFVSNMGKDTIDFDLFKVKYDGKEFGSIDTLFAINSNNNELFPYFFNHALYFSSDRQEGKGGLDIYTFDGKGTIQPMPAPFNSEYDDFAISFLAENKGYFSSNRQKEVKDDDIFEFYVPKIQKENLAMIEVNSIKSDLESMLSDLDSNSTEAIILRSAIAKIKAQELMIAELQKKLMDSQEKIMNTLDTASFLTFDQRVSLYQQIVEGKVMVEENQLTELPKATQEQFKEILAVQANTQEIAEQEKVVFNEKLKPFIADNQATSIGTINELVTHYEMADTLVSQIMDVAYPIAFYFDFDHFDLHEDQLIALRKFIKNTQGYKGKIVIEGHTDSKGPFNYNLKLSKRRAQFVADLLVKEGFSADHITIVPKGEAEPVADNQTIEGRRMNRRAVIRLN